ncbi:hypothetical protein NSK_007839 [Nannochloropsis salina CCMP1776]|uniref:Uncharacterized protein n=1 Tax=Nannochloropsis salina CCMP1776 TaxID=1027361 RepID=A0A4D9CW03_9STRA|nr:hypothetical protein NSK_007839 [Nannochloropsis salina CCMP1776]|eukprot:TFJ80839.1 hypothetical protein NSK_007839 [Nannochloropsis salina CCMP1776]
MASNWLEKAVVLILSGIWRIRLTLAATLDSPSPQAWPSSYTVANAPGHAPFFGGDSFVVYSQPMTTKYGEACNERQAPIPLPAHIAARFNGSVMAVTGLEVDVVQVDPNTGLERSVPRADFYNHHYILGLRSALYIPPSASPSDEEQVEQQEAISTGSREGNATHGLLLPHGGKGRVRDGSFRKDIADADLKTSTSSHDQGTFGGVRRTQESAVLQPYLDVRLSPKTSASAPPLRNVSRAISALRGTVPLLQVFCEANGGEYKETYRGFPPGYAQLIASPAFFWPIQLHFINTRASIPRSLVPASSRADPTMDTWNGLIECPCSNRRTFDLRANLVDGKPPYPIHCQGEVLAQSNPVCSLATYQGGLRCCEPGMVLLDREQRQPVEEDTYLLKARFWYEEYREEGAGQGRGDVVEGIVGKGPRMFQEGGRAVVSGHEKGKVTVGRGVKGEPPQGRETDDRVQGVPRLAAVKDSKTPVDETYEDPGPSPPIRASHAHLFKVYLQTEQWAGEYDVPPCDPRTTLDSSQCVHVLTSLNVARELFSDCAFSTDKDCADLKALREAGGLFKLVYAAGHVHVGGLSLELINADTGALICRNEPIYDSATGLIARTPPCVWGDVQEAEGEGEGGRQLLPAPPVLHAETRLLSIARYNSSGSGHLGGMASWQMRAAYAFGGV